MKKCFLILSVFIISCKTTSLSKKAARQIEYTNYQLTVAHIDDSIRIFNDSVRISNLEKLVVILPANQWVKNPDGTVTMTN